MEFDGKRSCLKKIRGYDTGEERGGSRPSFANDKNNVIKHDKNNDKNNILIKTTVIVNYLLSNFLC